MKKTYCTCGDLKLVYSFCETHIYRVSLKQMKTRTKLILLKIPDAFFLEGKEKVYSCNDE